MDLISLFVRLYTGRVQLDAAEATQAASAITPIAGGEVYPRSITADGDVLYCLAKSTTDKHLVVIGRNEDLVSLPSSSMIRSDGLVDLKMSCCWLRADNITATWLRQRFDWLKPRILGTALSVGCGDRLGLATPGHIRAVRNCAGSIAPIFAQQSIREMTRSARSPQMVIDDAMWGVFQEGYRGGYGADADHLKTYEDIDRCVSSGFTFFTFDPGAQVDNSFTAGKYSALPWPELESTADETLTRYQKHYSEETIFRGMVKYGSAISHLSRLYRHLKTSMDRQPFEVEISVDETEQPTTQAEHFMIASELRRLGVEWVSLAPRFVGRFEKGVDYMGDLKAFEVDCAAHAKVAREFGPYKLSIHSGSDKFSIYPIVARHAGRYAHLKTAGTSYLEALRTIARCDRSLFQKIYAYAHERYAEDRASYHVSAKPEQAPPVDLAGVIEAQHVLDQFDAREMMHVCFGSILTRYGEQIKEALNANEATHYADLERHFNRHLSSFC